MSEYVPGVALAADDPAPARLASVAIIFRRGARGAELFWLKRRASLRFAGGYFAFPGGRVDPDDRLVPVHGAPDEASATRIAAAARELFEETGVLAARGSVAERAVVERGRRDLLAGSLDFGALLEAWGATLDAADFPAAGRWVTPTSSPIRFDTHFHLVELPEGQTPTAEPGEYERGEWIAPEEALARWAVGAELLHPPTLYVLRTLAERSPEDALAALAAPAGVAADGTPTEIEFQQGLRVVPLRSRTLPPATHTNAYVLGNGELVVVDPGADEGEHLEPLRELLAGLLQAGFRVRAIVLTHDHVDHVAGAAALQAWLKRPIWAHEETARRRPELTIERALRDGDTFTLAGEPAMQWHVLHTPGHAAGHLVLIDDASRACVAGDMVAGMGTVVIPPEGGDMGAYVAQLRRLTGLVRVMYPAHGQPIHDGPGQLAEYEAHRRWREERVAEALESAIGPLTPGEVLPLAYADVAEALWPVAELNTRSILAKLEHEGRAARVPGQDRWGAQRLP
jgi:glyoxylase-like metal-dependent hydrolase (beta-lactamase superfamily II)